MRSIIKTAKFVSGSICLEAAYIVLIDYLAIGR